ncbi:MAG: PqqD family protein [Pseudomonadota bacterium]
MSRHLFSPSWHQVAELKPRLVAQALIHRQHYRRQLWYLVQDRAGGRFYRLSPAAHALLLAMDGQTTVQEIWHTANTRTAAAHEVVGEACTQNELVDLLVQLHAANLLQADVTPDSALLFERYRKKRWASVRQYLLNPLSLKLPLYDPDALITRCMPYLAWFFSRRGGWLWLALVLPAIFLAAQHWAELTHNLSDRVLSSSNLWVMFCVFPIVKLLHELGHAFAVKAWGGAVHEMGLMFLIFAPVPYVDASSAAAFADKRRRMLVAAAGMLCELLLAALALYVWLLTEAGVVRAIAFNVMLIAGVSTLIVNGNPLLRYDAYFILCDALEMPNLAQRGQKYLTALCDRHLFAAPALERHRESAAERRYLLLYTPLSWCYRVWVSLTITLFIAGQFFIFGVLLALWGAFSLFCLPLWKAYRHLTRSPSLQQCRARALRTAGVLLVGVVLVLFALPIPLHTRAEGVVWLPEQAMSYAGGKAFFQRWLVQPGTWVRRGTALYLLEDRQLDADLRVARARVDGAEAKYRAEQFSHPVQAAVLARQLAHERAVLQRLEARAEKLIGYAALDGVFVPATVTATAQDWPGRYLKQGELVAYVLDAAQLIVRVVLTQDDIDLVRTRWRGAQLRFAESIAQTHPVVLQRVVPAAVGELPTSALSLSGGGSIATLPSDNQGVKTIDRVFLVDLQLPATLGANAASAFGERVYVRFDHGYEPLGWQLWRRLRQLFLSQFNV